MRRVKIGTAIDATLLAKARATAVKERKHLNNIIEESLEQYLASKDLEGQLRTVLRTRGQLNAPLDLVKEILEEPYLET
ncbi:MAG TPA: hypothetical protein DEQ28_08945 [Clostridiales bacterium]|nr:hypothetical protein [Clostridiales bacterium]